jgi:hypothetical protein
MTVPGATDSIMQKVYDIAARSGNMKMVRAGRIGGGELLSLANRRDSGRMATTCADTYFS